MVVTWCISAKHCTSTQTVAESAAGGAVETDSGRSAKVQELEASIKSIEQGSIASGSQSAAWWTPATCSCPWVGGQSM